MKTLLVIAPQSGLAAAIRAVLDVQRYRVISQPDVAEAERLLELNSIDFCVLDAELNNIGPIRLIERLKNRLPQCPIILFASEKQWEWEEDAYLLGVSFILTKPVRGRLFNSLLDRLQLPPKPPAERPTESRLREESRPAVSPPIPVRMLEVLRDFSSILSHSLCAEGLSKQFLKLLREIIGVNRASIFLRQPMMPMANINDLDNVRRLRACCALGLPPGLLEHFELSMESGIGGYVFRSGRILRRNSIDTDIETQKEFELLGAQVAIPILDRESFVGVAVFDGRLTGDPLANEELALIFHLLEELGMAIKNIWLHGQLAANHEMMADILRQLNSACVVVGRDLAVLHANETALKYFRPPQSALPAPSKLEFSDLPQVIGSKVFEVLKTGRAFSPFKYEAPRIDRIFQVTISPFQKQNSAVPTAVLLLLEDFTKLERLHQLEIETANLRLVKQMAERLAHEIGNAVVPLSTYQQLLPQHLQDPDFAATLVSALGDSVKRVTRLVKQMRFLASDQVASPEIVTVHRLVEEAFREACQHQPNAKALLQFNNQGEPFAVTGDRLGLQHAFAEVLLNALQASADATTIQVTTRAATDLDGGKLVQIEISDNGTGFTPEAAEKAHEPFFTTRNVGLGLGLSVSNKIIESHRGKLEIPPPKDGGPGLVRISLPIENVFRFRKKNGNGNSNATQSGA